MLPPVTPDPSGRLMQVARYGLAGAEPGPSTGRPPDDEFRALLWQCERHRLLGLLGAAVRGGVVPVTTSQHDAIEELLQAWLAHGLRVERLLIDATTALDAAGIRHRVLKGVALAHLAYPDPAWRVFGDGDLLVPGRQLTSATDRLATALGLVRSQAELRPGFDDRFGKEVLLTRTGRPELDVHRTFAEGALGLTIDLADLFGPSQPFTVGAYEFHALSASQQLIHAAYAAVIGDWPPRLMSVRDVAQVLLVLDPPVDEVLGQANRWRAEAVLARALTTAWAHLQPDTEPALVEWARSYKESRRDRALLASHIGPRRGTTRHLAALAVIPGLADRAAYLRAIAWPHPDYLHSRGLSRRRHLTRAVDRLRT